MSRVLVTGSSGFIGRHVLPRLLQAGHEVFALRHTRPGHPAPAIHWETGDLLQESAPARMVQEVRPEVLLHLAWYVAPGRFWEASENLAWVEASRRLVRAFAENGGKRVVAVGTGFEYDFAAGTCDEATTPLRPATLYGRSKNELRAWLEAFAGERSLSWSWGRIFWLYGPFEHPDRLVAHVIGSLLRGEAAKVSSGEQRRDFLHVADVAAALVTLVQAESTGAVNVCSGKAVSIRDVVSLIGSKMNCAELLQFGALPPGDGWPQVVGNNQRLLSTGWRPQFDLEKGIEDAIRWWKESARTAVQA